MLIANVFVEWTNTLHPMYDTSSPMSTPAHDSNKSTHSYAVESPTLSPNTGFERSIVDLPFQILHTSEHDVVGVLELLRPPLV